MTLVVTGATGLLGSALLPMLTQRDGDVVALHRPGTEPRRVEGVHWLAQDLARPLGDGLPAKVDGVFHLAQSRRFREFPAGAVDVIEVNTMATTRLLDYCLQHGGRTFVYASSGAVTGAAPTAITEDEPPEPSNLYGVSKYASELVVAQYRAVLAAHSLRYFFIYGPGQRAMMMPGIIDRVRGDQAIQLAGENGISINPVNAEDAARATAAALDLDEGATINVAGPQILTIRQIAEIVGGEVGKAPTFEHVAEQPDFIASIELMSRLLGAPTTTPSQGLARMVAAG